MFCFLWIKRNLLSFGGLICIRDTVSVSLETHRNVICTISEKYPCLKNSMVYMFSTCSIFAVGTQRSISNRVLFQNVQCNLCLTNHLLFVFFPSKIDAFI